MSAKLHPWALERVAARKGPIPTLAAMEKFAKETTFESVLQKIFDEVRAYRRLTRAMFVIAPQGFQRTHTLGTSGAYAHHHIGTCANGTPVFVASDGGKSATRLLFLKYQQLVDGDFGES